MDNSDELDWRSTNFIALQQKICAQNNNLTNEYESQTVFFATIEA